MKKMSFENIQGTLSRDEMRKIMAGSGPEVCGICTKFSGASETCMTDPLLGGACMGCEGLCY